MGKWEGSSPSYVRWRTVRPNGSAYLDIERKAEDVSWGDSIVPYSPSGGASFIDSEKDFWFRGMETRSVTGLPVSTLSLSGILSVG